MTNFLLDTNVLRYSAGSSPQLSPFVQAFWQSTVLDKNHTMYVGDETIREIELQSFRIPETELELILYQLIPSLIEVKYVPSVQREHELRQAIAYALKTYNLPLPNGSIIRNNVIPSINDARLMLTALDNDLTIVTNNIKDFIFYQCVGNDLFDPVNNIPVPPLSTSLWNQLQADTIFKQFVTKIL
ncbi:MULTISPECIES: DUF4411 family protein [Metabacillus]|uniref:DUF4411 family protein n=2 Tax=Metabacillus TaxID=2675233 RepID=A0A179T3C3_9BACI|nr:MULTISPECIES: DUF4411 family protein [Metabacillus]OAS87840.1 hypothetical protein A6K24_19100 [Metabacillus litoralis]QNF27343.1 DUF4411 family protein [Metabacillus sp. KUDC1714]